MTTSSMLPDNNFETIKFPSIIPELDPGPIKLDSDFTETKMDTESIKSENIDQSSSKSMEQESFKSMSMETESFTSSTTGPASFTSTLTIEKEEDNKDRNNKTSPEIEEGKIKNTLKEIITEIDAYAEKDEVLKESNKMEAMEVTLSDGVTGKYENICDFQSMETVESNGKVRNIVFAVYIFTIRI